MNSSNDRFVIIATPIVPSAYSEAGAARWSESIDRLRVLAVVRRSDSFNGGTRLHVVNETAKHTTWKTQSGAERVVRELQQANDRGPASDFKVGQQNSVVGYKLTVATEAELNRQREAVQPEIDVRVAKFRMADAERRVSSARAELDRRDREYINAVRAYENAVVAAVQAS